MLTALLSRETIEEEGVAMGRAFPARRLKRQRRWASSAATRRASYATRLFAELTARQTQRTKAEVDA
jgi:hypothetical protein